MILCAPSSSTAPRVSGATIYTGHTLKCVVLSKMYIISRTSKPVSRLIKASCNPLSADEILSITVLINVRCSYEIAACPSRSLSTSDRTPDGAGLFCLLSSRAGCWGLRVTMGLSSGLTGSGEASVTTLRGHPLLERGSPGEAFRSPSSPEEDPPKTSSAEKG